MNSKKAERVLKNIQANLPHFQELDSQIATVVDDLKKRLIAANINADSQIDSTLDNLDQGLQPDQNNE